MSITADVGLRICLCGLVVSIVFCFDFCVLILSYFRVLEYFLYGIWTFTTIRRQWTVDDSGKAGTICEQTVLTTHLCHGICGPSYRFDCMIRHVDSAVRFCRRLATGNVQRVCSATYQIFLHIFLGYRSIILTLTLTLNGVSYRVRV